MSAPALSTLDRRAGLSFATLAILALIGSTSAYAYKPPRWSFVPLTPALIDKAIECWPGIDEASKQVEARVPGTTRSDAAERRRLLSVERARVLTACGFPDSPEGPGWRSTTFSILHALRGRTAQPASGTRDEHGNEVEGAAAARIQANNRRLVRRYKPKLDALLRR